MIGGLFLSGLALGLSLGPTCAASCGPLLSVSVAGELGRGRRAWTATLRFLAGRLIAYAAVGAAAGGLLGAWVLELPEGTVGVALAGLTLALGLALIAAGLASGRRAAGCAGPCAGRLTGRLAGWPFLLGLAAGLSPCPQFVLAGVNATASSSWAGGLAHFLGLYTGTCAFLLPAALLRVRTDAGRAWAARAGGAAAVLVGLFFAMGGLRALARQLEPAAPVRMTEAEARCVLPAGGRLERRSPDAFALWRSGPGGEKLECFAVRGEASGYVPGLVVAVRLSPEGKVLQVEVLRHGESSQFMEEVLKDGLPDRLVGRGPADALEVGKDVDAVSGATLTSRGLTDAVRGAVRSLEPGATVAAPGAASTPPDWKSVAAALWKSAAAALYLVLVAALLPKLRRGLRLAVLAVSIVVLGSLFGRLFSVSDVTRLAAGMLPPGPEGAGVLIFLGILAGVTLWRGRMWCSHCCPFGALSELAGRAVRSRAVPLPSPLARAARLVPWLSLAAVAGVIAWTGRTDASAAEPFGFAAQLLALPLSAVELATSAPAAAALFALLLLLSMISARFYCRHLCGAGALLGLVCRMRRMKDSGALDVPKPEGESGGGKG